jgi:hypothetical protein
MDMEGRCIVFDLGPVTLGNFYLHSGTDSSSHKRREHYCAEVIPQLLVHRQETGLCGGDLNCITSKADATRNPESKMSPSLRALISTLGWEDSFRALHPSADIYSRYYSSERHGEGASRIDRSYHWGGITVLAAEYHPIAFSDHLAYTVTCQLPALQARILSPRARPIFKVNPDVVTDPTFQETLRANMTDWLRVKALGVRVLVWWEELVKPGIRRLAKERGRVLGKERRGALNLLLLRQSYLIRKVMAGHTGYLTELKVVQGRIMQWYDQACSKIALQSRIGDLEESEKVRIYHHSLHQKHVKRSSILRLQTERGLLEGHTECAQFLEDSVAAHLLQPADLDPVAQEVLLAEVEEVFTKEDNEMMCKIPDKEEVLAVLKSCNLHSAPGTDGLTGFLYRQHWDLLGDHLTEIVQAVFNREQPTASQRTSMMVFGTKPKKKMSLKPTDKRKISLLNVDFKLMSGVQAARLRSTMTHTVSQNQLVAGSDRRMQHGIALARDAIFAAGKAGQGCGILDTDLVSAFCNMALSWTLRVLERKGLCSAACARLRNLYVNNYSIIVVNNVLGRCIENVRLTIRQGDKPSMEIFTFGIDPLLHYLERRLRGITVHSLPVHGPVLAPGPAPPGPLAPGRRRPAPAPSTLPPLEQKYTVIGYADDVKPAITCMEEFLLVDRAMRLLERSSGCMMHRDPASGKCKFLPLGRWRGVLTQEDLPCNFFTISDHLDMLGVTLKATHSATKRANGDELVERVRKVVGPWRAGRHMELTMRPHLVNCVVYTKMFHRCSTMDLRVGDYTAIAKQVKGWLYADLLEKPAQLALHRGPADGGLGLHCVRRRALAFLVCNFLQTACSDTFHRNLLHEAVLRFYIHEEPIPKPPLPPYFKGDFLPAIRRLLASPVGLKNVTVKQVYKFLMEEVTMTEEPEAGGTPGQQRALLPLRVELAAPTTDWPRAWRLARQRGLGPRLGSFIYKMLHQLLPTGERVARILPAASAICSRCGSGAVETLHHALFICSSNNGVPAALVAGLRIHMPSITSLKILTMDFETTESMELPVTWVSASFLSSLWALRTEKRAVEGYVIRSDLEAAFSILSRTKLRNQAVLTRQLLTEIFNGVLD